MDRIPVPALLVLVGASGSGKSTWAEATFGGRSIVSSDSLRAILGEDETDQVASAAAFAMLEEAVRVRLDRGLTTVIDTVGHDPTRRRRWLEAGRTAGLPVYAVVFDVPAAECKRRNRNRERRVPDRVIDTQSRALRAQRPSIESEGWDDVIVVGPSHGGTTTGPVDVVAAVGPATGPTDAATGSAGLRFGLHISTFGFDGSPDRTGARLASIARAAEDVGFSSIRMMDHPMQIPQVGRVWDDILEPMVGLAHVAAHTSRVTVGPLVAGITYRNVAHLGKAMASLDVLSGGRAECGIGAAWFEREHRALGYPFPPLAERYALLEDALEFLPVLWGPGTKTYEGRVLHISEAVCYPRPLRGTIPILVGGQGERRTLALVARHADACNLFGPPERVAGKLEVLEQHCRRIERPPADVRVTHLSTALVGRDGDAVRSLVDRFGPERGRERWEARVNAGTVDEHVARFRALADVGVHEAIVSLEGLVDDGAIERFAPVIDAFA